MQPYSHVTVGATSMNRALRFYDAVLAPLGLVRKRTAKIGLAYAPEDFSGLNEPFWVVRPLDGNAATAGNGYGAAHTTIQQRVSTMLEYVVSEGRLFALKPSDWSMLLGGVTLCGLLTLLFG